MRPENQDRGALIAGATMSAPQRPLMVAASWIYDRESQ